MIVKGNIVDVEKRRIYFGDVQVENSKIVKLVESGVERLDYPYIIPGFVDAHVHIESSMLIPSEFARLAIGHGTIATVSDPHEIANVLGMKGVQYMIDNAKNVPFHICYGAPSCVPATSFETAGATLTPKDIRHLLEMKEIGYLSEMMNYPGVLYNDPVVHEKLAIAKSLDLPVDGHAPGLTGDDALTYISAGISTDHECFTYDEAKFKIINGMKVIIREGSAAKNFEALWPLIDEFPESIMLCSDDKHPDDLVLGHINQLAARAVSKGCDLFNVLRVACTNAIEHYRLPVGQIRVGETADFILVKDLRSFSPVATYWKGEKVAEQGKAFFNYQSAPVMNQFSCSPKSVSDFKVKAHHAKSKVKVIHAMDGELITTSFIAQLSDENGFVKPSVSKDILPIAVVSRYSDSPPSLGFIHGFGLKKGAIASSVAHDSHNIVAVGVSAKQMCIAVNKVIENQGGICATDGTQMEVLPLPVAGIMSNQRAEIVASGYQKVHTFSKEILGSSLTAPMMALSFMALLVIPSLKISDKGLFDGTKFRITPLQTM